jgi:hypothetical protein
VLSHHKPFTLYASCTRAARYVARMARHSRACCRLSLSLRAFALCLCPLLGKLTGGVISLPCSRVSLASHFSAWPALCGPVLSGYLATRSGRQTAFYLSPSLALRSPASVYQRVIMRGPTCLRSPWALRRGGILTQALGVYSRGNNYVLPVTRGRGNMTA